jgi:endonuclease/exonuclease/phosphatase family metal-dependent hydrolase
MKLISLNTWGGRSLQPLLTFLEREASSIDVFCLQEIFNTDQKEIDKRHPTEYVHGDLFGKIGRVLKNFNGHFAYFEDNPHRQSLAMFIKRSLLVQEMGDLLVYKPKNPVEHGSRVISSRKLQYAKVATPQESHTVINYHGLWDAGPKTDTEDRLAQSQTIKKFLDKTPGPKILGGDFNILPETKSMKILEQGMRNLVKDKKIKSTRTLLYRHYHNPKEPNFADYILVSPEIKVIEFKVLPDLVSDHSPLYLEYTVNKK